MPTVLYGGKTYNTVRIGIQCWLKENLNIGTRINGSQEQTNNSSVEKYCYNDLESNCDTYGGLYQWNEWMNYTTSSNSNPSERQGICPNSWHVPSDAEWCQMESYLDASVSCSSIGYQGTDIGGKLKQTGTSHWAVPNTGATDVSGFTGLPGGYRIGVSGGFQDITGIGAFWSSFQSSPTGALGRSLYYNNVQDYRTDSPMSYGFSARCIKDTCSSSPNAPASGTQVPAPTQIIWNWNTVSGATGYKWNTTNVYTSATDMGTAITKTETGLTCNTPYVRYAWAYNACGNSMALTMNQATSACPVFACGTSTLTINHLVSGGVAPVNKTTTYGTVTNIPGETSKCWITSNLGSDHQATAVNDATEASAGWYWQFNRKQGFKHDGTTRTPNTTWITTINENLDWQTANDPCALELGTGWRIPTSTEWTNVDAGWTNWNGPYGSALKLHAAGYLPNSDGSLSSRGSDGDFWSGMQYNTANGWYLYFNVGNSYMVDINKAYGFSARCIK
jgi:uncharacterized protein (TIGR02145 family)